MNNIHYFAETEKTMWRRIGTWSKFRGDWLISNLKI